MFGRATRRPWRTRAKPNAINPATITGPGDCVSMDQIESSIPGLIRYEGSLLARGTTQQQFSLTTSTSYPTYIYNDLLQDKRPYSQKEHSSATPSHTELQSSTIMPTMVASLIIPSRTTVNKVTNHSLTQRSICTSRMLWQKRESGTYKMLQEQC